MALSPHGARVAILALLAAPPRGGRANLPDGEPLPTRERVVRLTAGARLPVAVAEPDAPPWNGAGPRFGPNTTGMPARAAEFVDRILRGARPVASRWSSPRDTGSFMGLRGARSLGRTMPPEVSPGRIRSSSAGSLAGLPGRRIRVTVR